MDTKIKCHFGYKHLTCSHIGYIIYVTNLDTQERGDNVTMSEHRKKLGLTQCALAETVGVKRLSIARYESGARKPSPTIAKRIACVLQLTTEQMWEMFYGEANGESRCIFRKGHEI